jgi:hypothetical protein
MPILGSNGHKFAREYDGIVTAVRSMLTAIQLQRKAISCIIDLSSLFRRLVSALSDMVLCDIGTWSSTTSTIGVDCC